MRKTKTLVMLVFILLLAATVIHQYATDRFLSEAVDFYNFWAVPTAQKLSGHTLGSPYQAVPQYDAFLKDILTRAPDDIRLFRATAFWYGNPEVRHIKRNNTPLLYTAFGIFPERFSTAAALFRWAEVGLFVVAVLLLAYLFGIRPPHALVVGMAFLLILFPVHRDLSFGNVNTFLLCALTALLTLYRLLLEGLPIGRPVLAGLLASGMVLLILFKPLVLVPCLLLALLFGFCATLQDRVAAVSAGLVTLLAGVAGPSWFFRSWAVWHDWFQAVKGNQALLYPSLAENCSLVMILAEQAKTRPILVMSAMGALLAISLLMAVSRGGRPFGVSRGHMEMILRQGGGAFTDAGLVVSIGIILTLALSPLVWSHYYVLAIIPALWLCTHPSQSRLGMLMAATYALASSEPLAYVTRATDTGQWYVLAQALSWIPLWTGILISIGSTSSQHPSAEED